MIHPKTIAISDYVYDLPDERIAKYPLGQRDESKLLAFRDGNIEEFVFNALPNLLPADTFLVYNNTKVIRARILFYKATGAKIEIFCLEPHSPADYAQSFQQTDKVIWRCMVGHARKWKEELLVMKLSNDLTLTAKKMDQQGMDFFVEFSWNNPKYSFSDVIELSGNIPIPPYLNRQSEVSDLTNYQTVYAQYKGSVAAPTAGLHFTDGVLEALRKKGVETDAVTLHVGAGTFQPVKSEQMAQHPMHTESIAVSLSTIANLQRKLGHIIAVGTTSVRTIESLYWIGALLKTGAISSPEGAHLNQWTPYELQENVSASDALSAIIDWMESHQLEMLHAETQIIIAPGYTFRIIEGMLTNFHQPKSTLLLLVSALVGECWRDIYAYALAHDFRFLSYGDSSLLMKQL